MRRARYLPAAVEILLATAKPEEATEACKELAAIAVSYATQVLQAVAAHAEECDGVGSKSELVR